MRPHASPSSGFALIVSLTLMAFIALLIISLSTLLKVELQSADAERLKNEARANALLGIQLALGRLQEAAGPDQRATGSLEAAPLLAAHSDKRHWVGVWRNQATYDANQNVQTYQAELETVLVSGQPTTASLQEESEGVVIVGADSVSSLNDYVTVPLEAVTESSNFAYWISDESTKALVNLREPSIPADDDAGHRAKMLYAPRYGIEQLSLTEDEETIHLGEHYTAVSGELGKVHTLEMFQLLLGTASPFNELIRERFHDITAHSAGLLTDQRRGGLRRDLTWMLRNRALPSGYLYQQNETIAGHSRIPGPAWSLIQNFYELSSNLSPNSPSILPREGASHRNNPAAHVNPIAPILTQAKLYFDFTFSPDGHLRMHIFPAFALHNPYNFTLAAPPAEEQGYRMEFYNVDGTTVNLKIDLTYNDPDREGENVTRTYAFRNALNSLFYPDTTGEHIGTVYFQIPTPAFAPGETKVFSLADELPYNGPLNKNLVTAIHTAANNIGPTVSRGLNRFKEGFSTDGNAYVEFKDIVFPPDDLPDTIEFELIDSGSLIMRIKQPESRAENVALSLVEVFNIAYAPSGSAASRSSIAPVSPRTGFSYQIELDTIRQMANYNVRGNHVQSSGYTPAGEPPLLYYGSYGTGNYHMDTSESSPARGFFGPSHRSGVGHEQVVLFEIPNRTIGLVSLGQFQHIDLSTKIDNRSVSASALNRKDHNAPSYIAGNSLADPRVPRDRHYHNGGTMEWNELKTYFDTSYRTNEAIWDGFFFSTVPADYTPGEDQLINRRFTPFDATSVLNTNAYSASTDLAITGAFNVNSTSKEAWKTLLSSLRDYDLKYQSGTQEGTNNVFSRFSYPFSQAFEDPTALSAAAWQGVRRLSDRQVDDLAQSIVDEVKARGPFLSLAQFINRKLVSANASDARLGLSGALQAAIDATDINEQMEVGSISASASQSGFPASDAFSGYSSDFAPGYLTQADLLTLIGPVLSARGDTFVIRSYGNVTAPGNSSSVLSEAYAEAVVQRMPEKVSGSENIQQGDTPGSLGRRFKVVSFRWLSAP